MASSAGVGDGEPEFQVGLRSERALRAIRSLDEGNIAEAYLRGDIDLEGDMLKPFTLRKLFDDRHPLVAAWRFIEPLLFGQIYTNKQAISSHYNADPKLFLSFLDPVFPAYSQGVYEADDELLSTALERKFDWAIEKCELGPGKKIGPGWRASRPRPAGGGRLHRHHHRRGLAGLSPRQTFQFRRPVRHSAL